MNTCIGYSVHPVRGLRKNPEMRNGEDGENDLRGLLWKLPLVESKHLGKVGPAFGFGTGCGLGFGVGLVGGAGFGPGFPGLHIGYGFGAGCGIGLGFGYGFGRGVARDDHRRYSNVRKLFNGPGLLPSQDELTGLIDELVINTKKVIRATSKEIDKWRR